MLYFGIVENIVDPQNAGRVQVRIYPFYRDFAVEDLPWSYVLRSTDLGNTAGVGLNMHNLIEGSQVLVEFLDNKMQQPIVLGVVPRETDFANMQSYVKHTLKFVNGSEIEVDETPDKEYIKIIDNNKNYVLLSTDGITIHVGDSTKNIVVESSGDVNIKATNTSITSSGNTNVETSGETTIKSSGETTIEGSKLNLKNILGKNQLCSLPACLFTGGVHQSPNSD